MAGGRNAAKLRATALGVTTLIAAATPVMAGNGGDAPDSFAKIQDNALTVAYLEALSTAGESATGKLRLFQLATAQDGDVARPAVTLHAVQDRGLPRGEEYPTYLFRIPDGSGDPELIHATYAGTRIYVSEFPGETGCLVSAEKGYSDICLADIDGNAAPDLPGLREDVWSDLIKLFGL